MLMLNSPLLLNYLNFGASFLQESMLNTEVFILVFCPARVCAVAMAMELIKNKAYKMVFACFKKIQSLDYFHRLPTTNKH